VWIPSQSSNIEFFDTLILESKPETILFDMKQVNYINFSGLRVILKTIMKMRQLKGNVYITDFQPQVKEMFEIMIGALPHWLNSSRKQLENCLDLYKFVTFCLSNKTIFYSCPFDHLLYGFKVIAFAFRRWGPAPSRKTDFLSWLNPAGP
jgi:anti-anti-sigma factor